MCCYLSKPFSEKDLLSYIRLALSPRRRCHDAPRTPSDVTLRVEELNGPIALEKITPEWELLDAQVPPRTPFMSPLWTKLWWRHLRQARSMLRQEFFAHIVRDQAGRLLAIAPMVISHRPAYGPLRLRLLQFFGAADGSITEHRRIICREDDELQVIQGARQLFV